jgi:starvation-inducible DNA-binding protein
MSTNDIGLKIKDSKALVKKLNNLLANYEVYYQNLRNFHWNVNGENFFELHAKFEELYDAANIAIDETAERILTLGERPYSSFEEFISNSEIKEAKLITDPKKMVETIKDNLNTLLVLERGVMDSAEEHSDEGTADLMSKYIAAKEKVVWMLSAYLR